MRIILLSLLVLTGLGAAAASVQMRGQQASPADDALVLTGRRATGGDFALRELRGEPVAVIFVRSGNCGLCAERLRALAASVAAYERLGVRIVVVTADEPAIAAAAAAAAGLDATVVSVAPGTLGAWGLWPDGVAAPMPGEFVLTEDGTILFAHRGTRAADYVGDVELLGVLRRHLAERRAAS